MSDIMAQVQDWFYSVEKRYWQYLAIAVAAIVLMGGGYFGYATWRTHQNEKAQIALSESVLDFQNAVAALSNPKVAESDIMELFKNVKTDMEIGYQQHKWSALAPFFLVYQAQAMTYLHELEPAYELMKKAVKSLDAASPYYMMFSVQTAFRALELPGHEAEGLQLLQKLAQSNHDLVSMAQYYLADYYIEHGKQEEGKQLLQTMVEAAKKLAPEHVTPYQSLAAQKLESLV